MLRPICAVRWYGVTVLVCGPSTASDIKQRTATRCILNYPGIKYEQQGTILHLHPLFYLRKKKDALYVFKCIKGYYDVSWYNIIETHL